MTTNPCHMQMDFDSVTDDRIQELIDSVRSAECASCHSLLAHPDDLHILEQIEELDSDSDTAQADVSEWPLIFKRVKGRPYCECCSLKGMATGKPDEGARYHEQMTSREFRASRQLAGVV